MTGTMLLSHNLSAATVHQTTIEYSEKKEEVFDHCMFVFAFMQACSSSLKSVTATGDGQETGAAAAVKRCIGADKKTGCMRKM